MNMEITTKIKDRRIASMVSTFNRLHGDVTPTYIAKRLLITACEAIMNGNKGFELNKDGELISKTY